MDKIYFIAQGLFEKSDSIGFDCVYQYKLLKNYYGSEADIRLFSERFDEKRYAEAFIQPAVDLDAHFDDPQAVLIYHFCDGWPTFESKLRHFRGQLIIRWHNNTPPWFFGQYSRLSIARTISGFRAIQELALNKRNLFMCNSRFTRRQLEILGITQGHLPVVYPASRYLNRDAGESAISNQPSNPKHNHLLFVGRVVAHKGHKHVLSIASKLQEFSGERVVVSFPGRADDAARGYVQELREMASALSIDLRLPGEIDSAALDQLYSACTTFVCMSEHEGFGLPIYEAMVRDVPVVVWANTALSELIEGHPLAFSQLDYSRIAHAIYSLKHPGERERIIAFQRQRVLPEYTKDVVLSQLLNAVLGAKSNAASEPLVSVPMHAGTEMRNNTQPPAFEIANNFVTQYDILSYRSLLEDAAHPGLIGTWQSQHIEATKFIGIDGPINDKLHVSSAICTGRHVVYGPYLRLPEGRYAVQFEASLQLDRAPSGSGVRFDVVCDTTVKLAEKDVLVEDIESVKMRVLEFEIELDQHPVEFRIQPYGFSDQDLGTLSFWGINLTKLRVERSENHSASGKVSNYTHEPERKEKAKGVGRVQRPVERASDSSNGNVLISKHELASSVNTDHEFLAECYRKILGRGIDATGLTHYLGCLKTSKMDRSRVILSICKSAEAQRRRVRVIE